MNDRLKKLLLQQEQYRVLLNNLTTDHKVYGTHKETGIVYDIQLVKEKLSEIDLEIDNLSE